MKVKLCSNGYPWDLAENAWFFNHRDKVFDVVAVHESLQRIYEVDVSPLVRAGQLDIEQAFVPAFYAEEVRA